MRNKEKFNANDYYKYNNEDQSNNSEYDKVFQSYNSKGNRGGNKTWIKIITAIIVGVGIGAIGVYIYSTRDKISDIVGPKEEGKEEQKTDDLPLDVELQDNTLSLTIGTEQTLNYKMINKTDVSLITFSSTNPEIVTVDKNGKIKALAAGDATILLTYMGKDSIISKICQVTVKSAETTDNTKTTENTETTKKEEQQKIIDDIKNKAQQSTGKQPSNEDIKKQIDDYYKEHEAEIAQRAKEGAEKARAEAEAKARAKAEAEAASRNN